MFGLTLQLQSLQINKEIIHPNEKVKVSVVTKNIDYLFKLNISNNTKYLIFIFEKNSLIKTNPIVASKVINANDFPHSPYDSNNFEIKKLDIFVPNNNSITTDNIVAGQMIIQYFLSEQLSINIKKNVIGKNKIHKKEDYSYLTEKYQNNCALLDNEFVN